MAKTRRCVGLGTGEGMATQVLKMATALTITITLFFECLTWDMFPKAKCFICTIVFNIEVNQLSVLP